MYSEENGGKALRACRGAAIGATRLLFAPNSGRDAALHRAGDHPRT